MWRSLWQHRELLFTLVKRDLKVRYKSSSLGFLWSLGRPFFLMLVIWAIFSAIVKVPSSHPWLPYTLHLLVALLPWMYFQGAVAEALYAILGNDSVIKKVYLPTEVFVASTVAGHLIHYVLASLVLIPFLAGFALFGEIPSGFPQTGEPLGWTIIPSWEIVFFPFLVALQTLLIFALALIVASLNVKFRDVASISEILLTAWFYMTPVIYGANFARSELQDKGLDVLYWLYLCNPMTPIVVAYRRVFFGDLFRYGPEISDATLVKGLAISVTVTVVLLFVGIRVFRAQSRRFADEL